MRTMPLVVIAIASLGLPDAFAEDPRIGRWQVMQEPVEFKEKITAIGKADSSTWGVTASGGIFRQEFGETKAYGKITGKPQLLVPVSDTRESATIVNEAGEVYVLRPGNQQPQKLGGKLANPAAAASLNAAGNPVLLDEAGIIYVADERQLREPVDSQLAAPRALFPNGELIAGLDDQGMLAIKTTSKMQLVQKLPTGVAAAGAVGVSVDGRYFVVADKETPLVELWDLASRKLVKSLTVPGKPKVRITLTDAGDFILSVDEAGIAFFTEIKNGETVQHKTLLSSGNNPASTKSLTLGNGSVVTISPDGKIEELTMGFAAGAGPLQQYVSVPVYYATNRDRATPPSFLFACFAFYWSLTGILAAITAIVLVIATIFISRRTSAIAWCIFGALLVGATLGAGLDRGQRFDPDTKHRYGAHVGKLNYGQCTVTVPQRRNIGELNSPFSFWVIHFPEDPESHIVLQQVEELPLEAFRKRLTAHATAAGESAAKDGSKDDALLFIHGYNVTFEDAVRRTAQLSVDLQFAGPAMCFTWPSFGETPAYTWDATNAENSVPAFQTVLNELNANAKLRRVHIIAHSMGNRVLTKALTQDGTPELNSDVFREIVLAAPDVDRTLFVEQIAPKLAQMQHHITLYASSRDNALAMSKVANGGQRAGDTRPNMTICAPVDSIDATAVDTSLMGHSYFSDERSIVDDLHYLLGNSFRPPQRFALERQETAEGVYWRIRR